MSFVLLVMWEIISQGPIKPCTFSHRSQVIFKDWLLLLWCCAYPLKPFIVEQRNRLVWGLHVRFSENFFRNSRTKCPHIQQLLNHKTIKPLRPWFFCLSTFPEIEEYKISVPVTLNKEIKKLLFLPSKMGSRLIHGIDLYAGKYANLNQCKLVFRKHLVQTLKSELHEYGQECLHFRRSFTSKTTWNTICKWKLSHYALWEFIIKFLYNTHSHWFKQRALWEYKARNKRKLTPSSTEMADKFPIFSLGIIEAVS